MVGYRTGHYDEEDESPRAPHEQDDVGSTQGDAGDPDGFDADEFRFDSSNFGACGARCARGGRAGRWMFWRGRLASNLSAGGRPGGVPTLDEARIVRSRRGGVAGTRRIVRGRVAAASRR